MGAAPARQIAFDVLRRVESEDAYAGELLHARLKPTVKHEDAALATELTLGVLRWQRLLDLLIERLARKPAAKLDPEVRLALRLGVYQLRFLTRVPVRAAVHESVELVKRARKRSAAGLVNAVLRRISSVARTPSTELVSSDLPPAERLGILHSHPTWLVARWLETFGAARALRLLQANNTPARLTCAVLGDVRSAAAALQAAGLHVEPGHWLRETLTVHGGNLTATEAYRRGWISVQDEASQMVALLLGVERGESVLDLCAAPGGKTVLLARAAGPNALVVAADLHPHRLRAMRENLQRVGAAQVRLLAVDAIGSLPLAQRFDRILLDAPCSGTGTLARNPEIRWRLRPEDLGDFHGRQVALLSNALEQLAPGGRLVYSTCSLEPEENEQVIRPALESHPEIRCAAGADALAPHLGMGVPVKRLFGEDGFFRTFPPDHHTDGFFAAVLERPRAGR